MDLTCNAAHRWMYRPVRAACMRWCGQGTVGLVEDVVSASIASSSQSSWPFEPSQSSSRPTPGDGSVRLRSRYLERLMHQPFLQDRAARMAAHMAAQAAQVIFDVLLLFIFYNFLL